MAAVVNWFVWKERGYLMRASRALIRLIAGIGMTIGLLAGTAGAVSAGDSITASITVHLRTCDATFAGDFFAECHDNPIANIPFELTGGAIRSASTGADGNLTFDLLPSGSYTVEGGVPGEFGTATVFCSNADDVSMGKEFTEGPGTISLVLFDGEAVVCDIYVEPISGRGDTPTVAPPAATTATGGTTTLPSTGSGDSTGAGGIGFLAAVVAALALAAFAVISVRRAFR